VRIILVNSERGMRGGEFQTLALARGLQRGGCEVLIAARAASALSLEAAGSIPCMGFQFESPPLGTPIGLARLVRRWRADIIHAQTSTAHTHAWLARRLIGGAPPLIVSRRVAFPLGKNPISLLKYRTGVAHYIPISRAAAASLLALGVSESRMTVIPSGIDIDAFRNAKASREIAERWGIDSGRCIIGTIAAFEIEKGHGALVRAAADILRENGSTRFIFVGAGSLEGELRCEIARLGIAEAVICVPLDAPLEEMLPLFDIFVLPSIQEGLSTALIAAMAAGVPVVASETGGIPDVVSPDSGLLVPPGDREALAAAIMKLLRDEGLRRRMGEAGRMRSADFDVRRTVEKTLAVYWRIIGTMSRGRRSDSAV
jgi:glycosyltransferase involved in cell wall biosynthesis